MTEIAAIGHNSAQFGHVSQDKLRKYIERIEQGEKEKRDAATHVSGIYAEAKSEGFDAKIIRKVVKLRQVDQAKRAEESALLDLYKSAIGMLD